MKKRLLMILLLLAMILTLLPSVTASAYVSEGMVSGDKLVETLTTDLAGVRFDNSFNMVFVEGGTFTLGWQASDASSRPDDVSPVRNVTVSDFYIGETEVTNATWNAVMGSASAGATGNRPKEQINFYQVQEFLSRLYALTGKTYRLATEAEWEFAAKGGNPGFEGNEEYPGNNHEYLYAGSNVHDDVVAHRTQVRDVKTKKPNILGIYDMSGNAEEWVYNTWNSAHTGGVDPIGPGGPVHQQKTRRGGTYGTSVADSTRTAVARQIRSIDGGAGMGFRIALSGDMNSVPPGMVRPRDIEHPNIDERMPEDAVVPYRDPRLVTNDDYRWSGSFAGTMSFTMKLWETGEMVIQSPGYADRIGQWYSVSNLGIIFVEDAGLETETRVTLPYMFMTATYMTVINDVSFTGDGAPIGRFEKVAETATPIEKPEIEVLIAPETLAATSTHDHTSYNLTNITTEMRGKDERLLDGTENGWWQTGGGGIHQYRKDINANSFQFTVYSPAFGSGTGGANTGYGANRLAGATGATVTPTGGGTPYTTGWYTVNDMLLVIVTGTGSTPSYQHYLYTVTDEINSINVSGSTTRQLMHISYMGYEKGDQRIFELHPNTVITGYNQEIPNQNGNAMSPSTFMAPPSAETMCPGGCGYVISECHCETMCPDCNSHINNCYCNNATARLAAATMDAQIALDGYVATNTTTQAHLDAVVRLAVGFHAIDRLWTFEKVNATPENAGHISATVTLSLNGMRGIAGADYDIDQLPMPSSDGWLITPNSMIGGETVTMTAKGMEDMFTSFDIGSLFGQPGAFGFTYAMWFGDDGTFSFDKDITLTKGYFDESFNEIGRDDVLITAGTVINVAKGVYSEYMEEIVPWSEFSVAMDDGNSWMIIYRGSPGNYETFPPDTPISEFPGTVTPLDLSWKIIPAATVNEAPLTISATGLVEEGWGLFDLGLIFGTPGSGPYTYGFWFDEGGSVIFNQDVTLSYQGATTRTASAGEKIFIDESWSEYAITLDDGNSLILVYEQSPGNWTSALRTEQFSTFPGTIIMPDGTVLTEPAEPIVVDVVEVTLTAPATGAAAGSAVTATSGITLGNVIWAPELIDGVFAPETVYTASFTLTANEGYELAADFAVTVNGQAAELSDGIVLFTFPATDTEPTEPTVVNAVNIALAAPVAGAAPASATTASEGVSLSAVTWTPTVLGTFDYETVYTASVTVTANNGYELAADFTATINGVDVIVIENTVSFTFPATGIAPDIELSDDYITLNTELLPGAKLTVPAAPIPDNQYGWWAGAIELASVDGLTVGDLKAGIDLIEGASIFAVYSPVAGEGSDAMTDDELVTAGCSLWVDGNGSYTPLIIYAITVQETPVEPITINSVDIVLPVPVAGYAPAFATTMTDGVILGAVTWTPTVLGTFDYETVYTAEFTVTADIGYELAAELAATVNGIPATVIGNTISFTFPETEAEVVIGDGPKAYISGDTMVAFETGATAVYKISVADVEDINVIEITLEVDGTYFETKEITGLNGFTVLDGVKWLEIGGGMYTATFRLTKTNPALSGDFEAVSIAFNLKGKLGTTTVRLLKVIVANNFNDDECIIGSSATTEIKQFSPFDVNRDGNVTLVDLSIAVSKFMVAAGDANWDAAKACDVNNDGVVDIADLILISRNIA